MLGKVTIIKTIAISKLVLLFSSLPTPRPETMMKVNNILFKFLWNGTNDKIKRTKICQEYQNGVIKMIDVDIFVALADNIDNTFWSHVLPAWAKFSECYVYKSEGVMSESIWCNDVLKYKFSIKKSWRLRGLFL